MRALRAATRSIAKATHGHSQELAPVLAPPKKLLFVGYPTVACYCAAVGVSEEQWLQRMDCLLFDQVLLPPEPTALGINYNAMEIQGAQVAAAAIVSPDEQQLLMIERLRAASGTLFIICW